MSSKTADLLARAAEITANASDKMSSVACASRRFKAADEAEKFFSAFAEKLFQIDKWNRHSALSSFKLFRADGSQSPGDAARIGDFIRLTLAGSGKSDWVKIIDIARSSDEIILTVQPSFDPTAKEPDKTVTSHFFTSESTNNFCLQHAGDTLNFYVIGLDEKSNTADTNNIIETARNVATANVGHYLGIQKGEWTTFCENFLEIEQDE